MRDKPIGKRPLGRPKNTWYCCGSEVYEFMMIRHLLCEINVLENVHLEDREGD
jgi:hypothetical protein